VSFRFPLAIAIALVVTFGLFWTMQALIGVSGELKEGAGSPSIEFVRLKRDSRPVEKKREPPKREKPDQPPPPPDISMSKAKLDPGAMVTAIPEVDAGDALGGGIGMSGGADRDAVPLVRINPEYPMRARQRGIEGWVTIAFTISKAGTVVNPHVIASQPRKIFDKNALQAIRKWKYNPKIKDGAPVERFGQKVTLEFARE
jgi:protein TonB